jgi:hypothetical protein
MVFIDDIVCDSKNGTANEDLRPLCLQAYEKTLKKYHGWMVQQIFNASPCPFLHVRLFLTLHCAFVARQLVSRACPWRRDLLLSLALGKTDMESIVLAQMEEVLVNLKKNVAIINRLYVTYNLNLDVKV